MAHRNNIYKSRRQKEFTLIIAAFGLLIMLIIVLVIALAGKDSQVYHIGPVVSWEDKTETETSTQTSTEKPTETETGTSDETETEDSTETEMQTAMEAGTNLTENEDLPEGLFCWEGHYYAFYDSVDSWDKAIAFCEEKGGYIASITSNIENEAVHGFMLEHGIKNAYFGLYRNEETGIWEWVHEGETAEFTNWNPGEPNGERGREKYGMFYYKYTDGAWNDGDFGIGTANGGTMFICEWDSYPENF